MSLLLGRQCEGNASHFRLEELRSLARELGLTVSGVKADVCQRIRTYLLQHPEKAAFVQSKYGRKQPSQKVEHVQRLQRSEKGQPAPSTVPIPQMTERKTVAIQTLQQDPVLQTVDLRPLIALPDDQLENLIDLIKIHDGKDSFRDLLKDAKNPNQRIQMIVDEMAGKLCRCLSDLETRQPKLQPGNRIAICISSIFHSKGITISRFNCKEGPVLLPRKGQKAVILPYSHLKGSCERERERERRRS